MDVSLFVGGGNSAGCLCLHTGHTAWSTQGLRKPLSRLQLQSPDQHVAESPASSVPHSPSHKVGCAPRSAAMLEIQIPASPRLAVSPWAGCLTSLPLHLHPRENGWQDSHWVIMVITLKTAYTNCFTRCLTSLFDKFSLLFTYNNHRLLQRGP